MTGPAVQKRLSANVFRLARCAPRLVVAMKRVRTAGPGVFVAEKDRFVQRGMDVLVLLVVENAILTCARPANVLVSIRCDYENYRTLSMHLR